MYKTTLLSEPIGFRNDAKKSTTKNPDQLKWVYLYTKQNIPKPPNKKNVYLFRIVRNRMYKAKINIAPLLMGSSVFNQ